MGFVEKTCNAWESLGKAGFGFPGLQGPKGPFLFNISLKSKEVHQLIHFSFIMSIWFGFVFGFPGCE